ncbi:MAG: heme-binding domain-containing protein [Chitinophagaceae bacterium]
MKSFKKIILGLLIVFVLIQFIQPARNVNEKIQSTDITKVINVPENIQAVLRTSCNDCHSNHTNYPWYSRVQPFGWLLAKHIMNGKAELNFNEFGSYSLRRQSSKLKGIENSIKDGTMPLGSYTLLHRNAKLSQEDKIVIIDWLERTRDSISSKDQ